MRARLAVFEPRWLLVFSFFIAGVFLGSVGMYLFLGVSDISGIKIHPAQNQYKFVNPLLAVDLYTGKQAAKNKVLELELAGLVESAKKEGAISDAAIYFRDIEPGFWLGINEDNEFSPGKLLKIPIMIAYYKLAETTPGILDKKILFSGDSSRPEEILHAATTLEQGTEYSVDELIQAMIVNSDDYAANLLFDNIDKDQLNEIFSDLGVSFQEDKETRDFITLKLYSLFFRVLYNATYLNREYSEKALSLLVEADNSVGLGALLPKKILIANRIGARSYVENGKKKYEIYDCGIVYFPSHPYLICATTQGNELNRIEQFLAEVGNRAYLNMSYQYKQ